MEQLITQTRVQFEQILSYIQGEVQNQQLHEVEKGIFSSLLKIGLTLLTLFLQSKGIGRKDQIHTDKAGVKRPYHSIKCKAPFHIWKDEHSKSLLLGKRTPRSLSSG